MTPERRRHRLFVTRHTEYHVRSDECVGVRDLASGRWVRNHAALRLRILRPIAAPEAQLGIRLQFWGRGNDVVTSPVTEVGRPPKPNLDFYVSHECAGQILT